MSKLKCHISISLDGYVAGPNQSKENPLGEGGEQLHDWVAGLAAFRRAHGEEGGEVNASTPVFEESIDNLGAGVMGRNMFGPIGGGAWTEECSALEQAKKAAGGKDVMLWGGGQVVQQYLAAGLLDELEPHVVPVLLGGGSRLLDNLAGVRLEQVRSVEAPGVTHIKYRRA